MNYSNLSLTPSGHGHYRVTTNYYGKKISCITNNMPAIDDYKSYQSEKDGRELKRKRGYITLRSEVIRKNKRL